MATKRVSSTAIDWAKFAQNIPAAEETSFNALRSKNQVFNGQVKSLPAELPKIDFAHYKKAVPSLGSIVDTFATKYSQVKIDYPSATKRIAEVDAQQKEHNASTVAWMEGSKKRVADAKTGLSQWSKVPPLNQMTMQEWQLYFPGFQPDQKIHSYFNVRNWIYGINAPEYYYHYGNYRFIGGSEAVKWGNWDERDETRTA